MSNKVESELEEKKKLKTEGVDKNNENSWAEFGISIVKNIIVTLIIGVLGANFIYLTSAESRSIGSGGRTLLDYFLPTDDAAYGPMPIIGGARCSKNIDIKVNEKLLKKFGIGMTNSWPYKQYRDIEDGDSFTTKLWKTFINWFAKSTADSYITNRSLLKKWLDVFSYSIDSNEENENIFSNETFQMFIASPLMILAFPLIIIFIYFSSWFSMFKKGWKPALIGLFLIYSWVIPLGVTFVQSFQYLFTFMFIPLFADIKGVKKIFGCNVKGLSIFFGLLICSSAFTYLNTTISVTMFVVYLLMLIKSYW
jgi:hypothetical protein